MLNGKPDFDEYGYEDEDDESAQSETPAATEPPPEVGQTVRVLVENVEDVSGRHDERGMLVLSKRKAEKIEKWLEVMEKVHEGDVVTGKVTRKIKGGLLVDIGVNVFLPASQVDIRRPHDIGEYLDKDIQCMVLKIDDERRNIVVSRRSLIEQERSEKKAELLKNPIGWRPTNGCCQEHRRLRCIRRPWWNRRPSSHHRHELGPHQPPKRNGEDRRRTRSHDPAHRLRERENRSWSQAEVDQPLGKSSRDVPSWYSYQGNRSQRHVLRCFCKA